MPWRALLIDFGGTLATETPSRGELYARSARARGVEIDAERMGTLMAEVHRALPRVVAGRPRYADPWFERFIEEVFHGRLGVRRTDLPELTRELFARFAQASSFRLYPGALELLDGARDRGLRVALVSNWSEHLGALAADLGIAARCDVLLSSAIEGHEKPDPAIFRAALDRVGVAPHEALFAGNDPLNDIEGARAVGIEAVLVDHQGVHMVGNATARVRSLPELAALVFESGK